MKLIYMRSIIGIFIISLFFIQCSNDIDIDDIPATTVSAPMEIDIYAYGGKSSAPQKRLYIPVTKIGDKEFTGIYSLIDTGSEYMVLKGDKILPSHILNENGVFFAGEAMLYNGIKVTKYYTEVAYGGPTGAKFHCILAYAPIRIGKGTKTITTKEMPILVWFKKTGGAGDVENIMGVNIQAAGKQNDGTSGNICYYMDFGSNIKRGFRLQEVGTNFPISDSIKDGAIKTITFGLNSEIEAGYKFSNLTQTAPNVAWPYITTSLSVGGNAPISTNVMIDSGSPDMAINVATPNFTVTNGYVPNDTKVTYKWPDGQGTYSYLNNSSEPIFNTSVNTSIPTVGPMSIIGLGYFFHNGLIYDYTDYRMGLKIN